eukprot:TRINITY_DN63806_c0_g1_i1.p1 TRINITY_DN63806_c0_g1~~TRINITY_DN63806_c0_g1_i1.p1  ORF type:complete len:959 (-),score=267.76 TRINITY_DN63806_c0_g1_i1:206-3022(-)
MATTTAGGSGGRCPLVEERAQVNAATAEAAARLRLKQLASLSCKEAERLVDGNFRVNDEMVQTLQQAWETVVRLDCQLTEAVRPDDERNRCLQSCAAERTELVQRKAHLEGDLLMVKMEVQMAAAGTGQLKCSRLADVLEANLDWRERCFKLGEQLAESVSEACRVLREVGERPTASQDSGKERMMERRWRMEFEGVRDANDSILKAFQHPDAARAIPPCQIEERIDDNWRFLLELVGLLEKVVQQDEEEAATAAVAEAAAEEAAREREGMPRAEAAKKLLLDLEELLPRLLERKYLAQEAAAKGEREDLAMTEKCIAASRRLQASVWKFLGDFKVDITNICLTKFAEEMLPHPAAFRKAAVTEEGSATSAYPPLIRLLTYNIFMRSPAPGFTHNTGDDKKDERLSRFAQHLNCYDVVCLQEAYGSFTQRRDWLVEVGRRLGFAHDHRSPTSVRPRFLIDGGLLILSRLPMLQRATLTYEPGVHMDRLSAKGALYARLQCGRHGPYLHVCTTHMQSTYSEDSLVGSQSVRKSQVEQLVDFLRKETNDAPEGDEPRRHWPLLLCGTFNTNGRRSAMDGSHSKEYLALVQMLHDGLGEVRDLIFDIRGSHLVTYADTRLTGSGEVPAERVLTSPSVYERPASKRQCLDYVFFFPGECWGKPATDDSPPDSAEDAIVPATCQVEKFLVDRAKDVGAPVTQLSDHYGVEANFTVVQHARADPAAEVAREEAFQPEAGKRILLTEEEDEEEDTGASPTEEVGEESPSSPNCVTGAGMDGDKTALGDLAAAYAAISSGGYDGGGDGGVSPAAAPEDAPAAAAEEGGGGGGGAGDGSCDSEPAATADALAHEHVEDPASKEQSRQETAVAHARPKGMPLLVPAEPVRAAAIHAAGEETKTETPPAEVPRTWPHVTLGAEDDDDGGTLTFDSRSLDSVANKSSSSA